MNLCAAFQGLEDCEHAGGNEFIWGDFCRNNFQGEAKSTDYGEGILVAVKPPGISQSPRGIMLRIMYQQEFPWIYELLEEP
jgi:hypothetical protein